MSNDGGSGHIFGQLRVYGLQAMNSDQSLPDFVWQRANEISGRVREIREDLHAHAEIRYQEFRTAKV